MQSLTKFYSLAPIILTFLAASPGYSENSNWSYLGQNDDLDVHIYMHLENLTFDRKVNADVLYNFTKENLELNHKHRSEIESITIDCVEYIYRIRNVNWYESDMGTGEIVFNAQNLEWMDIGTDSVIDQLHTQYCKATT